MTRIVAGVAGGRRLLVPGSGTRPTSERVREALFSRLEHLDVVDGARVLDLYAGSGALGLEAASRGAVRVDLVERAPAAARVLRQNVKALALPGVTVHQQAVAAYLAAAPPEADLILADPPYAEPAEPLLAALVVARVLSAEGVFVLEQAARTPVAWPDDLVVVDNRTYGDTRVWTATWADGALA